MDPAHLQVAACVEAVREAIDDQGLVRGVGAVRVGVPPAEIAGLPLACARLGRGIRGRGGYRGGIRGRVWGGSGGRVWGGSGGRIRCRIRGRVVEGHPVQETRVAAADGRQHDLRGLTIAELDFLRRLVGGVDEHQVCVRVRLLDGQRDVLSGLGQRAVVGARVEEVGRVAGLAGQGVDNHEARGGRRGIAEDLGRLGTVQAAQLLEVADDDVAGQTVVDGADVGHRHVDQADSLVGGRGLVAGGKVTVGVAAQRRGIGTGRVLAGLVGDERGVHGLRVVTDVGDVAEDGGELVERTCRRTIVVDDRGAVVAVVLHTEQAEPLLAGGQAQGRHDRLLGGGHVRVPVVVQVLAVQDWAGAVTREALEAVFALFLPRVGVQQVHDDVARSWAAVGSPVVLVPAE